MRSGLTIKGIVKVTATPYSYPLPPKLLRAAIRHGIAFPVFETENLVTDIGLDSFVALLGGGQGGPSVGGDAISPANIEDVFAVEMRITDQVAPTAPAGTDVALEGATEASFTIGGANLIVTYPSAGKVQFSGTVGPTELNGQTLTEEGLFNANGRLVARTTFSKLKEAAFGLQFDHVLTLIRTP